MRKALVTLALALASSTIAIIAQESPSTESSNLQNDADQDRPTKQKVIKDPAEYNAYINALNILDPAQKAAAMEAFVAQYPDSVVKSDALQQALAAYQMANNASKVEETAQLILADDPGNMRSLAILTYLARSRGSAGEVGEDAEKGLAALPDWTKPDEGMSDADFEKLKNQMADIFYGAAGFAALQAKDYATAKSYYLKSIAIDPANAQDVYQLSIAELESDPVDVNGFWYAAKAICLTKNNGQAGQVISDYAKSKYRRYHGSLSGWDDIVKAAATQDAPPGNLADLITPSPAGCEVAVKAIQQNDVDTLSFSDWEFVLSHAECSPDNQAAAETVWQAILAKQKDKSDDGTEVRLKLPGVLVISSAPDTIQVAITDDNQQAWKADLTVMLEAPMGEPPPPGTFIDVTGVFTKYAAHPFMFTMENGASEAARPARPPARRGHPRSAPAVPE